jgi:hypothetical protein
VDRDASTGHARGCASTGERRCFHRRAAVLPPASRAASAAEPH